MGSFSVDLETQSVNAKVNALSKGKEKEKHKCRRESEGSHDEGYESHLSRSSRSQRSERVKRHERHKDEPKRNPIELIKGKIPPFLGDGKPNAYYDWEMSVEKILNALIWNEIAINIRGMRRASIES
ncbi:hypothetical protein CR513_55963, partial [Mucuna pruriens]